MSYERRTLNIHNIKFAHEVFNFNVHTERTLNINVRVKFVCVGFFIWSILLCLFLTRSAPVFCLRPSWFCILWNGQISIGVSLVVRMGLTPYALLSLVQICMISWRWIYSVLNDTNYNFSKMFLFMQILCDSNWVGYLLVAIICQ